MKPELCPRFGNETTEILCNNCFYNTDKYNCSYTRSHLERNVTLANMIKRM